MSPIPSHTSTHTPASEPAARSFTGNRGETIVTDNRPKTAQLQATKRMIQSSAVVQRSATEVVMPGLGGDESEKAVRKKRGRKKGDKDDEKKNNPPPKRATRSSVRQVDLNRPTLTYDSQYSGVATQKLNTEQSIYFSQQATLLRPNGAVNATEALYDFRQQVTDSFQSSPINTGYALGPFVQDGPFRPNYGNENIDVAAGSITFNDHPGFSGDRKIGVGNWLDWYEVRFRWVVRRRDGQGNAWTSPEVVNRIDSAYNAGADVPVAAAPAGAHQWAVDLT